ncbi:hypothetical protein DL766_005562 [Monosporascus sp. MC13-8B]|uniref:C2H2-type domain-containing protein n=1 Tax=Monosporascus cannonballus TaxID=155416 RepID=A0ABY0HAN2_9PEZI|nr:hypothetical protein DL762_004517 [Monosporascus cannonballus]RYO94723.1 hypothetical protein DL763_003997 [Monosporascus cannonballus]RYP29035.1 hypothetical protein DL766_005562 [Monosporascus sp. MC13-8B]
MRHIAANPSATDASQKGQNGHQQPGEGGSSTQGGQRGKRKSSRTHGAGSDDRAEEGDDDGDQPRPHKAKKLPTSSELRRRFACPFYKRYPERFRGCGLADYENPSRVKQHITRRHLCPIYCSICFCEFENEELKDMHVRRQNCSITTPVKFIYATRGQVEQLRKRRTLKTHRETWNAIFGILFPGDPLPGSPYLDATVFQDVNLLRELFLAQAPTALAQAIDSFLPEDLRRTHGAEIAQRATAVNLDVFERVYQIARSLRSQIHPCRNTARSSAIGSSTTVSPSQPDTNEPAPSERLEATQQSFSQSNVSSVENHVATGSPATQSHTAPESHERHAAVEFDPYQPEIVALPGQTLSSLPPNFPDSLSNGTDFGFDFDWETYPAMNYSPFGHRPWS